MAHMFKKLKYDEWITYSQIGSLSWTFKSESYE